MLKHPFIQRAGICAAAMAILTPARNLHANTIQRHVVLKPSSVGSPRISTVPRTSVACNAAATVELGGDLVAGSKRLIRFATATGGGFGPKVAIGDVAGKPVYVPAQPEGSAQRQTFPRLQYVSVAYDKIMASTEARTMINGWFSQGVTITQQPVGKDYGDGTAEVLLPSADGALFRQRTTLFVTTDRCKITVPVEIRPKFHFGRWYPPALIAFCAGRVSQGQSFGPERITSEYRREFTDRSRLRIADVTQPHALFHNCGPYGAVHEGGDNDGVGGGLGVDTYLFWDGGFDPKFKVSAITDTTRESCVAKIDRVRHADGGGHVAAPAGRTRVAKQASRGVVEVSVSWRITARHGYCWYALKAEGMHPVSLPDTWVTQFTRNNLAAKSSMVHGATKTELNVFKESATGALSNEVYTAAF